MIKFIEMLGLLFLVELFKKFIKDNLPDLHYKNIFKMFTRYVMPIFVIALVGLAYLTAVITRNQQTKKIIVMLIIAFPIAIAASHYMQQKDKKSIAV